MTFDLQDLAPEAVRRMSRHEFDRLIAVGLFADERIELLRGVLVTMSRQSPRHATIASWLCQKLGRHLDESFDVRSHSPIAAGLYSEPETDVSVAFAKPGLDHPSSALLLIEVTDPSSDRKDRLVKAGIYAETGCPEYWIVDISGPDLVIEVHRDPSGGCYRAVEKLRSGDVLRPVALPGVELRVADIPWY